jgi:very-short-patch-repair endonuclease
MKKHPVGGAYDRARALRQKMTDAERSLWRILRSSRMDGHRCRRQEPFGHYIADFVCHDARLIIEIDGGQHDRSSPDEAKRTRFLEDQGYRIRRFWNNEVLSNLEGVCATIARDLQRHPIESVPPPSWGREPADDP